MWPPHPHQKALCALFVSIALISYYGSMKDERVSRGVLEQENLNFTTPPNNFLSFSAANDDDTVDIFKSFLINASLHDQKIIENRDVVHILGLFELTDRWGRKQPQGMAELAAAKLAIDHVNDYNVLPGYRLEMIINDTKCDPGVATDRLFHAIYSRKTVVMLLGAGCSNVSERLAHVVPYWNIIQVSFGSKSPTLSDRGKFPLFFRTAAPDSSHNTAKIQFVKRFGWKTVASFSQSENAYLLPVNYLVTELEKVNVSCFSTVTFSPENYRDQLRVLKDLEIRIIIGSFSYEMATKIFCAVYEMKMFGSEYVWILQEHETTWWDDDKECSNSDMKLALEGVILVADYEYVGIDRQPVVSVMENSIFINSTLNNIRRPKITIKYAKQAYDAIWAMALTLRESNYVLNPIRDFRYNRKDMMCGFFDVMSNLSFLGLSGPVKFNGADRIGDSIIRQVQGGQLTNIAVYDSTKNILNFKCKSCHEITWPNGHVPIDKRTLKFTLVTIPNKLFYAIFTASLTGIFVAFLFFYFNLHYRSVKTIKMSSPKLNNVAVTGCILVYLSVILLEVHNVTASGNYFKEICSIRIYLLSAGFSLAFGSIFAKSYRVHRLFAYSVKGLVRDKLLKDKHLIGLILVPPSIDCLIMTLWFMIDPMDRHLQNLTMQTSTNDPGVVYQQQIEVCSCHNTVGWYFALLGYKGFILVMGVYMAWKTRHIKIPALNESQYIAICVYSVVFSTLIVILFSFLTDYFVLGYVAKTLSILAATTVTLFLLFLPKLKSVFRKIDTEKSIMQSLGLKIESKTRRFILDDPREVMHRLEIQNRVHRCELQALEAEIARLEDLLLHSSSTCSINSDNVNIQTRVDFHHINTPIYTIGRASWPSTCQHQLTHDLLIPTDHQKFHSENKLNVDKFFGFFGKLKRIFGSFTSLQGVGNNPTQSVRKDNIFDLDPTDVVEPRSYPELSTNVILDAELSSVKSENNISH